MNHVFIVKSGEDRLYIGLWIQISKRVLSGSHMNVSTTAPGTSRCSVNICFLILKDRAGERHAVRKGLVEDRKKELVSTHLWICDRSQNQTWEKNILLKHRGFKLVVLEQNRYGAQICFIYTVKYEFVTVLKNQETSHIILYFWLPLEKN